MTDLADRVAALDTDLFSFVHAQTTHGDKRSLLALHTAVAAFRSPFTYLEIGSYHGGSLQVLIRDPRCSQLMSIDPRTGDTPDETRGAFAYQDNTTERMVENLAQVPDADMAKLATFEATTQTMAPGDLPTRPDCCFVDGEHSHSGALNDARFCAEAMGGTGVIAFHDFGIVQSAIKAFIRERRRDISFALALNRPHNPRTGHGVFALELGDAGILRHPAIERATGRRSHAVWRVANGARGTAFPVVLTLDAIPVLESARRGAKRVRHSSAR
jgi:hypothetical protein